MSILPPSKMMSLMTAKEESETPLASSHSDLSKPTMSLRKRNAKPYFNKEFILGQEDFSDEDYTAWKHKSSKKKLKRSKKQEFKRVSKTKNHE